MKAIMYHYVRPGNPSLKYFKYLHIDDFIKQLDFFLEEYSFISKDEFIKSIETRAPIKNSIILTFDDGLKDHYLYVLPELEKRNLWGIFYVPLAPYITGELLDVHRIHMLIGKYGGKQIFDSIEKIISNNMLSHYHVEEFHKIPYKTQSNDEYTNIVKKTLNFYISYKFRKRVIDKLMSIYFPEEKILVKEFYMTKDEIYEMHKTGMLIGSHTLNHQVMRKLSIKNQKKEIENSFKLLETIIGTFSLKTFCYPYGGFHTFTINTERLLDKSDCLFSFNVEARDINENDLSSRRQALPRYDCNMFPFGSCRDLINKK